MREFQYIREDIPETWYDAAVLVDKVRYYLRQTRGEDYYFHSGVYEVLAVAHDAINVALRGEEYVSTYIPR